MNLLLSRAIVVLALVIWAASLAAQIVLVSQGRIGFAPLYVTPAADPDDLPRVTGLWPQAQDTDTDLRAGDRLISIDGRSAKGLGRAEVLASLFVSADADYRVALEVERDGRPSDAVLLLQRAAYPWRTVFVSLAFAVVGALAFRRRPTPLTFAFALACLAYAIHWSTFLGGGLLQTRLAMLATALAPAVAGPMAVRVLLLFPEEVAFDGRWARLWPWLLAANGIFMPSWVFGFPLPPAWGRPLALGGNLILIALILGLLALQYRRASALGRRQLRWSLLGLYVGLTGPGLLAAAAIAIPPLWWAYHLSLCAVVAIPVAFFIGLGRDQMLDVDRLIGAATSYSLLVGIALASLLSAAPAVSRVLARALSIDPTATQTLFAVGLAALVVPIGRQLQPRVERFLFRERYALEVGVAALRTDLARAQTAEEVLDYLGRRLTELLRPDGIAIYGRADPVFAPVFARGRAIAPAFDAGGPLVAVLAGSGAPLQVARLRRRGGRGPLAPAEIGSLDAMGVALVVPFSGEDGEPIAFLCLGEKASGDIYTDTDLTLLQTLAERATSELRRFGDEATRREERAMMDRLRRYVPGTIAAQLAGGDALTDAEREISVLFVDVRGYTRFSESREATEIFASVNRYTSAVSEAVTRNGGTVVEFNGDGMMAVFGAPRELPGKEASAVRAGRELTHAVESLALPNGEHFSVGVGIATGQAFVGNIRAIDRLIWSAIGNTTNLAARLEQLTRELEVAIVIDAPTFERAAGETGGFEPRPKTRIRGRSEPQDIYTLLRP
jgi:class 3 adenylate cyclase